MRRVIILVGVFVLIPATAVSAQSLEELLERSRDASYSAEQVISCSTPDGVRDALVRIEQSSGEVRFGSTVDNDVEVTAGAGAWTLSRSGGVVSSAAVDHGEEGAGPLYVLEEVGSVTVLGRDATAHRLSRNDEARAQLVFDDETGALLWATTFTRGGEVYCERRFVSFDSTDPELEPLQRPADGFIQEDSDIETALPDSAEGFERLDLYEDEEGFRFAYYSDGFFSFAVFETPTTVTLADGSSVEFGSGVYQRMFSAGQVTYVWETRDGGMALVGDLPPDLHEAVLTALPPSESPGFFRRIWRSLFG